MSTRISSKLGKFPTDRKPDDLLPKRSERRRNASVIADDVGAVRPVHLDGSAGVKAGIVDRAIASNDVP